MTSHLTVTASAYPAPQTPVRHRIARGSWLVVAAAVLLGLAAFLAVPSIGGGATPAAGHPQYQVGIGGLPRHHDRAHCLFVC
jgi:hypothetical protein